MSILLKRDTKVYLEAAQSDGSNIVWEIPVLDGFSYSQSNTTTEVALNEMESGAGVSRRGRRMFNDALDPVEWSFSTYIRPYTSPATGHDTSGTHHAVEELLWAKFVGTGTPGGTGGTWDYDLGSTEFAATTSSLVIDTSNSAVTTLGTFNIYFVLGGNLDADGNYTVADGLEIHKISTCTVNEATINFDVDGIAQIDWSGNGTTLEVLDPATNVDFSGAETQDISATDNYIRNKLTAMTMAKGTFTGSDDFAASYSLTLTGGSITFTNNITYLTPETLGEVNTPIGHITGNKSITGNFTCYMQDSTGANTSGDLLHDALTATGVVTNEFNITFKLGGGTPNTPRMEINIPQTHIEIPAVTTDDIIGIDVNFHALPGTIEDTDEFTLTYVGA